MTLTITLPEPLNELLERKATRLQIPIDELATKLLSDVLLDEAEDEPTLEEIVARIQALPPNPEGFQRAERAHDLAYIVWLLANPPTDTATAEEWERLWPKIEQEIEAMDRLPELQTESV